MRKLIIRYWNEYRRKIDIKILWPTCRSKAPNIQKAREIFRFHADYDLAWSDLSSQEKDDIINGLN
jgi:hypothetical protein